LDQISVLVALILDLEALDLPLDLDLIRRLVVLALIWVGLVGLVLLVLILVV